MRFLLFNGHPSMPANIPSYQIYLVTTFKVIGWKGRAATILESGEKREATVTMNKAINLLA
jgi:hypothetical protein